MNISVIYHDLTKTCLCAQLNISLDIYRMCLYVFHIFFQLSHASLSLIIAVAAVDIQQATYTIREAEGVGSICVTMTGMREIDLRLTFSTQPLTARGN